MQLLCWGERSLRILDLDCSYSESARGDAVCEDKDNVNCPLNSVSLSAATAEYLVPDWILSGSISSGSIHDEHGEEELNARTETRTTITTTAAATRRAHFVTSHNTLLDVHIVDIDINGELEPSSAAPSFGKYRKGIHVRQPVAGVKTLLYSADMVSLSPTHVLIAAGTVFGEVIVWSCFLEEDAVSPPFSSFSSCTSGNNDSSIHHFFTGHEGSIFGVRISPSIPALYGGQQSGRLLASCSDDRTIRIWDITDCEHTKRHDPSAYATDGFELQSTGFGNDIPTADDSAAGFCLVKAFGHIARIWDIYFVPLTVHGVGDPSDHGAGHGLTLVSRSEDASCLVWDLTWDQSTSGTAAGAATNFRLRSRASFLHHSGKHIWSLDMCNTDDDTDNGIIVYTGGADGALKASRIVNTNSGTDDDSSLVVVQQTQTKGKNDASNKMRAFCFVASDCFLSVSYCGEVRLGWIRHETMTTAQSATTAGGAKPDISWEMLCVEDDLRAYSIVSGLPEKGLALLGNSQGLIRLYQHATRSLTTIAHTEQHLRPLGLHALPSTVEPDDNLYFVTDYQVADKAHLCTIRGWRTATPRVDKYTLILPATFGVTCASLIDNNRYLALGSRAGALAVYRFPDAPTSTKYPQDPLQTLQPLTCFRRLHSVDGLKHISSMSSLTGSEEALRGYFLTCGRDGDYCLHELKTDSQDGNISVTLATIHRSSSSLVPDIEGVYVDRTSHHLMLFGFRGREFILWNESMQSEIVSIECGGAHRRWAFCPSDRVADSGVFLWNKTPGFRARCIHSGSHRSLRAGGHGREIKTMAARNVVTTNDNGGGGDRHYDALFATGAEDTRVRIFAATGSSTEGPWGAFLCMRVLNVHTTGPQQVSWSKDGEYLFTSGGHEEFFVWRIRSIPRFGVAGVLIATSPKDDPKSDLRVTSFDMLDVEGDDNGEETGAIDKQRGFVLCLTYSNSTIKIFHFSPSANRNHFTLLARGRYTSNCLTQACFLLKPTSINLITAATDGYATLWNLESILEPFYSISRSSTAAATSAPTVLLAKRQLHDTTITPTEIQCDSRYQIHSNSIKALEVTHISETASVMITGGDDNALTISLIWDNRVTSVRIVDAHASTISTLRIVRQRMRTASDDSNAMSELLVATSGNDHRVKMWRIMVDPNREDIKVEMILDRYSPVADISSLDVILQHHDGGGRDESGSVLMVICGVGMEMMKIDDEYD